MPTFIATARSMTPSSNMIHRRAASWGPALPRSNRLLRRAPWGPSAAPSKRPGVGRLRQQHSAAGWSGMVGHGAEPRVKDSGMDSGRGPLALWRAHRSNFGLQSTLKPTAAAAWTDKIQSCAARRSRVWSSARAGSAAPNPGFACRRSAQWAAVCVRATAARRHPFSLHFVDGSDSALSKIAAIDLQYGMAPWCIDRSHAYGERP